MTLDELQYGTPTRNQFLFLNSDTPLDGLFAELTRRSFPKNSSTLTKEELNGLAKWTDALAADAAVTERYQSYDGGENYTGLLGYLLSLADQAGMKAQEKAAYEDLLHELYAELLPLIFKLKYHFQRPRPQQLAAAYKFKLFPFPSNAATPSYPCGAAVLAKVICAVLGNRQPKSFGFFSQLAKDVCYSRQYMGLNFPSDVEAATFVAEAVLMDKDFQHRYQL